MSLTVVKRHMCFLSLMAHRQHIRQQRAVQIKKSDAEPRATHFAL